MGCDYAPSLFTALSARGIESPHTIYSKTRYWRALLQNVENGEWRGNRTIALIRGSKDETENLIRYQSESTQYLLIDKNKYNDRKHSDLLTERMRSRARIATLMR